MGSVQFSSPFSSLSGTTSNLCCKTGTALCTVHRPCTREYSMDSGKGPSKSKKDNFISLLVKTISTSFWAQVMLYTYIYNLLYVQCIQIIYLYSYTLYKECVQREYSVLCMSWAHFKRHSCNNTKTCTDTCRCTPDK